MGLLSNPRGEGKSRKSVWKCRSFIGREEMKKHRQGKTGKASVTLSWVKEKCGQLNTLKKEYKVLEGQISAMVHLQTRQGESKKTKKKITRKTKLRKVKQIEKAQKWAVTL